MHYFHLYYRYYKNVTEAILIQNIYLVNFFISFLFSPFIAQIQSVCIQIKKSAEHALLCAKRELFLQKS